jgi:preflagellin peptidase FlaK
LIGFETLNITSLILSTIILGYSAWMDLKTREVPDRVWIIYLPASSILLILRLISNPQIANIYAASILITAGISLLMFQIGLFGGADLKAMICLAVALPTNPGKALITSINPIFPLTILYNTYLLSIGTVAYILAKNVEWRIIRGEVLFNGLGETSHLRKFLAIMTGYKTTYKTLREKVYLYPMEGTSMESYGKGKRLRLLVKVEEDRDRLISKLGETLGNGEDGVVWVTPGIPLLTLMFAALLLCTFIGDILQTIVFNTAQFLIRRKV